MNYFLFENKNVFLETINMQIWHVTISMVSECKVPVHRNFKDYKKFKRVKTHALSEMNFTNAIWFSVASLLQQGGETYPKSLSGE